MIDYRQMLPIFQSEDVWNEIINIRKKLGIVIDHVGDNCFFLIDACDAFRIFPFGIVDGKWINTSLDYWENKTNIEKNEERVEFIKLLDALNKNLI